MLFVPQEEHIPYTKIINTNIDNIQVQNNLDTSRQQILIHIFQELQTDLTDLAQRTGPLLPDKMTDNHFFLTFERLARVEFNCYVIVKSKKWVNLINDELFK